MMDPMVKLVL
jgi:hypothetical protein